MDAQEKTLARKLFQLQIHEADGQKFEDIFTKIMNYSEPDFQQIKAWGNIGDGKCDGRIKSKGIYFQVFAPEDIRKSYVNVIKKLEKDFDGLIKEWSPVNEFYFVVNDRYDGVNKDCDKKIQEIKETHNLKKAGFMTPKDLENILFDLEDDQIISVVDFLPDPMRIKTLKFSILNEIIGYIMGLQLPQTKDSSIVLPEWEEKITFNNLTSLTAQYLNNGYCQTGSLNQYLKNNGDFLAEELKNKMRQLYVLEKNKGLKNDDLFWSIVNQASPKAEFSFQAAVIVIMAKYFETCDIFEEPKKG